MGRLRIDPEALTGAAAQFGLASDQSDTTVAFLNNATPTASAFGTTSAATQFVTELLTARERQLGAQQSARAVHDSARFRLQSARELADRLVTDTTAAAESAFP